MGIIKKLREVFVRVPANVKQSRTIAEKLNDTHIKYAVIKTDTDDIIVGRDGHVNIVDNDCFELVFWCRKCF